MVEAQGDVATTPIVRSKQSQSQSQSQSKSQSKSKSKSKPRHEPSTSMSTSTSTAIASSPRKWTLFHRGNRTSPSKKPVTLFQSRRRRQKQHNQSPNQNNQSTDRQLPINNDNESKTGFLRRMANKQKAKVQVLAPTGTATGTGDERQLPVPTEQSAASQTNSNPYANANPNDPNAYRAMKQSDSDLQTNSSQKTRLAVDMSTRTQQSDLNLLLHSSASGETPATYKATDTTTITAGTGTGTNTGAGTDSDLQGSERAVLIFDREKRATTSEETLQDKKVKTNRFTFVGKTIGAVVLIVILCWLVVYLSTKVVDGGKRMITMYHNFTSRMHTLGHILRVGFTVSAWGGTIAGWGYLVKSTKKFIERRRSDINPTLVNLSNAGTHIADHPDDHVLMNQLQRRSSRASFLAKVQVNIVNASSTSHIDHASQIDAEHCHDN